MKIAVINGSPKGKNSITLQTVLYLEKKFPACKFEIVSVGQKIKAYEKDCGEALSALKNADILLFAYPVYTFLAPYQLHRFIELMKKAKVDLRGKVATQITTSKHFYDMTAHAYIEENGIDCGLHMLKGLSADMDDLLTEQGRKDAIAFWNYILYCTKHHLYEKHPIPVPTELPPYVPSLAMTKKQVGFSAVIVTNCAKKDQNLQNKIGDFQAVFPYPSRVINIADYPFSGGCLGCFHCANDGTCIYKDGFDRFLREEIQTASAIIYAFTIQDHSMGASFKQYDDRQFCNGHRTVTMGMPVGYLVHGDYEKESNLQTVIAGRCEVGHQLLAGVATDAVSIQNCSAKLVYALQNDLVLPQNFYGVGGMKIFRDLIYIMRGFMKEDHRFYKKNRLYDFPQKEVGKILQMQLVGMALSFPSIQKKMGNQMIQGMLLPYKKVIEKMEWKKHKNY